MKFGLGPFPADDAVGYSAVLDHAALAEEEGFDSVWVDEGQQYSGGSPFPLGAAIAQRTRALRVGIRPVVGLVHPIYHAEDTAALDNISGGRLVLGLSDQPPAQSLAAYDIGVGDARARFWESVDVLYRAWAPDPFAHEGKYWKVPARLPEHTLAEAEVKVSVTPKPAQVFVPTWVATNNESGIRQAATRGLPVLGEAWETVSEVSRTFRLYQEAAGSSLGALLRPVVRDLYVAETVDEAWSDAEIPLANQLGLYEDAGRMANGASVRKRAEARAVIGDVDSVIEQLTALQEQTGCNYLLCRMALPGLSPERVRRSMTLLGRGVAPTFRMFNLPTAIRARTLEETGNPMIGYQRGLT